MIESLKKFVNSAVYEKGAEYPWAKIKDFIISKDGKTVAAAQVATQSLVPLFYIVKFCDFEKIGKKYCILKEGAKPVVSKNNEKENCFFSKTKDFHLEQGLKKLKIRDAEFMVEAGEIVDFVAVSGIVGTTKSYLELSDVKMAKICRNKRR